MGAASQETDKHRLMEAACACLSPKRELLIYIERRRICGKSPERASPTRKDEANEAKENYLVCGQCVLLLCGQFAIIQAVMVRCKDAKWLSQAHTEYSDAFLCRSGAHVATRAAGRTPMRGLARPSAAVV
jgi:hypothetical protein